MQTPAGRPARRPTSAPSTGTAATPQSTSGSFLAHVVDQAFRDFVTGESKGGGRRRESSRTFARLVGLIQQGRISVYLMYSFFTLLALLFFVG